MRKAVTCFMGLAVAAAIVAGLAGCDEAEIGQALLVLTRDGEDSVQLDAENGSSVFYAYWIVEEEVEVNQGNNNTNNLPVVATSYRETPPDDKPLALPIEWRVTNPELGSINSGSANSAVYVSSGQAGANTIIARDQYGSEGFATVTQE